MTDKTPCLTPAGANAMQARVRVTVIVGDNGSGKTALLREAACARARSLSDIYVHAAARITPEAVRAADWACGAVYFDDFGDSLDIRAIVWPCARTPPQPRTPYRSPYRGRTREATPDVCRCGCSLGLHTIEPAPSCAVRCQGCVGCQQFRPAPPRRAPPPPQTLGFYGMELLAKYLFSIGKSR